MTEELRLHVVSTSDSKGFRETAKDIKGLRGETDRLTGSFDRAEDEAFDLSKALEESRKRAAELRAEFARGGDPALFKEMRKERGLTAQLERVRKEMAEDAGSVLPAAAGGGAGAFAMSARQARGALYVGLGSLAALLSPLIGAAISGAVTGAVGLGGIAGGIAAASNNPYVKAAAADFAADFGQIFKEIGAPFVQPTLNALDELREAAHDIDLPSLFEKAVPLVDDLAEGVADFARGFAVGLGDALDHAGPTMRAFSEGLADTGDALGEAISMMARSEGAAAGMEALFMLLNSTIRMIGGSAAWLGDRFIELVRVGEAVTGALPFEPFNRMNRDLRQLASAGQETSGSIDGVGDASRAAVPDITDLGREAGEAESEIQGLDRALRLITSHEFGLEEAQDAVAETAARLREQLKEQREEHVKGAGSLIGNTQAARDNRAMVRDMVDDYTTLMARMNEQGTSTAGVTAQFEAQLVAMGFSRAEARHYVDALADLNTELGRLEGKRAIRVGIALNLYTGGAAVAQAIFSGAKIAGGDFAHPGGRPLEFQGGGTTPALAPFKVHRDETLFSDRQHYVATRAQTRALAGRGGASAVTLRVMPGGQGEFERFMAGFLSRYVAVGGTESLGLAPSS